MVSDRLYRIEKLDSSAPASVLSFYKESWKPPERFGSVFNPGYVTKETVANADNFGVYLGRTLSGVFSVVPKGQMISVPNMTVLPKFRQGPFDNAEAFLETDYSRVFGDREVKPSIIVMESPDPLIVEKATGVSLGIKDVLVGKYGYKEIERVRNRYFVGGLESFNLSGYILAKQIREMPPLRGRRSVKLKIRHQKPKDERLNSLFALHAASRFSFSFGVDVDQIEFVDSEIPDRFPSVWSKHIKPPYGENGNIFSSATYSEDVSLDDLRYDLLANPSVSLDGSKVIFDVAKTTAVFSRYPGKIGINILYDGDTLPHINDLLQIIQGLEGDVARKRDIRSAVRYLSHMHYHRIFIDRVSADFMKKTEERLKELEGDGKFDYLSGDGMLAVMGHAYEMKADPHFRQLFHKDLKEGK